MGKVDLRVDWATHAAAKYACLNWHYSKTLPAPPIVRLGVWEDSQFVGVVLFSRGASINLLKPYNLKPGEGCELTRIALKHHKTPVSKIVAVSINKLKNQSPNLRLIVSFADPMQGHNGAIYQAGNWVYSGDTSPDYYHVDRKGKKWHSRQVRKNGSPVKQFGTYRVTPDPKKMQLVETLGKHRYLMPLDKKMRKQILPLSKPYPKRVPLEGQQAPPVDGGSTPTHTLQAM